MSGKGIPCADAGERETGGGVIVLGGDARQGVVAGALVRAGYRVTTVGGGTPPEGESEVRVCRTLAGAPDRSGAAKIRALILPLPASRDGVTVSCPREPETQIKLSEVVDCLAAHPGAMLLGGRLPGELIREVEARCGEGRTVDYYEREDVQIRNARLSAEGAVMTAMEQTDTALIGRRAAVLGYGRIGKFLAPLLSGLGVRVTVCARRPEVLTQAECDGYAVLPLTGREGDLRPLCHGYDVLYNTVPVPLLSRALLEAMEPSTLIVDLASAPGCVDRETARLWVEPEMSGGRPRLLRVPSVPGRYAPRAAGEIIADAVLDVLSMGGG